MKGEYRAGKLSQAQGIKCDEPGTKNDPELGTHVPLVCYPCRDRGIDTGFPHIWKYSCSFDLMAKNLHVLVLALQLHEKVEMFP